MLDKLHNYEFTYFVKFYDYKSWLSGCYQDLVGISSCHYLHFTQEGVRAYTNDLENPISDAPIKVISQMPTTEFPPYFNCPPISAERLKKFQAVKKPKGTELFWSNILEGGLGTNQPKLVNPSFSDHVCYKKIEEEEKEENDVEEIEIEEEETVVKFGKLIEDTEKDLYLLETQFSGSKKFVLNERSCFIDLGVDGTTVTAAFQKWENLHPTLKRKFMSKPSENSSKKKKPNIIPKGSTGPILSSGRSRNG